ncbi:MAG: prolyl aminopeptidase [Nevskiaceae bacterium]|nr:MAG: prolyl aminopeptidase [Nevskiaceae bacterium]TBR71336.1 MAG: prolyl aminopeptidase [Nevskiaceae bacterium]
MIHAFPPIEPYRTRRLKVSALHEIHVEECGNPRGKPVLFVHGGPGGGSEPRHRQFFNPEKYRIVLFDQRGCGRSTPHAELRENTTWDLVADMELIRTQLGVDRWQVFGGSWGSTLALAYAETWPERVSELVLRGIFLLRAAEVRWFYQEGASWVYPDAWQAYRDFIPAAERSDFVAAYYRRLTSDDPDVRRAAALAWSIWEGSTSRLLGGGNISGRFGADSFADAFARIECHYFINRGFFERDGWLIQHVDRIRHIPATIVQGRYDMVCPMKSAWDLHRAWPEAEFFVTPDAGHAASEPGNLARLIEATERYARA